jgi:hypothetical protein
MSPLPSAPGSHGRGGTFAPLLRAFAILLLSGLAAHASPEGMTGNRQEEARRRAREVEEARVQALVQSAQYEGRGPGAVRAAREAEVARAQKRILFW